VKWAALKQPMPVACVIGWDPIMPFLAGSPVSAGVCEWDVMGAYRGEPAQLVRCETVDLEMPADQQSEQPCGGRRPHVTQSEPWTGWLR
jgi:4-hydroxy-3-polyprenylbenzoate decarboxylase